MPHFSGRTCANVPVTGYLPKSDVQTFMNECVRNEWIRVAVSDHRILAMYNGQSLWLHPEIEGAT